MSSPPPPDGAGLCAECAHARTVKARRGKAYLLCRLSAEDERFPRYPPLPVLACPGFEGRATDKAEPDSDLG